MERLLDGGRLHSLTLISGLRRSVQTPNFHSPHCVLFQFPRGAGGKTFTNCLGFSRHSMFQRCESAQWTYDQKWDWVQAQFNEAIVKQQWRDLGMGTRVFTGCSPNNLYEWMSHDTASQLYSQLNWASDFCEITHGTQHFFILCHTAEELRFLRNSWPNSQSIKMINAHHGIICSTKPRNQSMLPQDCSLEVLCDGIEQESRLAQADFELDGSTLVSQDQFLDQLETLYNSLQFDDWNQCRPLASRYWKAWQWVTDKI